MNSLPLPDSHRKRQVLYDVFQEGAEISEEVGLGGISADVSEMERAASMQRLTGLLPVGPIVEDHCEFLAAVFIRVQRAQYEHENGVGSTAIVSDDEWKHTYEHLVNMLQSTMMSGIALLISMGGLALVSEDSHGLD